MSDNQRGLVVRTYDSFNDTVRAAHELAAKRADEKGEVVVITLVPRSLVMDVTQGEELSPLVCTIRFLGQVPNALKPRMPLNLRYREEPITVVLPEAFKKDKGKLGFVVAHDDWCQRLKSDADFCSCDCEAEYYVERKH